MKTIRARLNRIGGGNPFMEHVLAIYIASEVPKVCECIAGVSSVDGIIGCQTGAADLKSR